jgi:hypothetical protein
MRPEALKYLGLLSQDWGPCYADNFSHAEFSSKWRGLVACPTAEQIAAAIPTAQEIDAEKTQIAINDPVLKFVGAVILDAVFDMKANPTNYPTAESLKQKALELYKAKL